jgi:twitching motility protein PilT
MDITKIELAGATATPGALLDAVLKAVYEKGASDLHLSGGAFYARLHGELTPLTGPPMLNADQVRLALSHVTATDLWERFLLTKELDCAYTTPDGLRFRVNLFVQRGSIGGVFRAIPTQIQSLTELNMPPQISALAQLTRGLVLVTGPTGSGKSTTLAALVNEINETRTSHVVTVEDPIEFVYQNKTALIDQREVGADTDSFAGALKHVLRQDPDVILIGELRDLETISAALTAAETGHLVFGTLHTQDAPQTIDRIIDVFPPHQQALVRTQLSTTLKGIICQNLVRNTDGTGRVAATEVMFTTQAIANLIRDGKIFQIPSSIQSGLGLGMHGMDQSLAKLAQSGQITQQTAIDYAHDKNGITQLLARP